ncbi:MAG: hypothetical protein AAF724_22665 [Pseudomonadota bacterium]
MPQTEQVYLSIMKYIALLLASAAAQPALAWQASVETGICILSHGETSVDVELSFDPTLPLYSITITRRDPWPAGGVFAMRFEGMQPIFIQTNRQSLSDGGRSLTVTDSGFGNVLDGLQFNETAEAILGDSVAEFTLEGAAPEVAAFRACTSAQTA